MIFGQSIDCYSLKWVYSTCGMNAADCSISFIKDFWKLCLSSEDWAKPETQSLTSLQKTARNIYILTMIKLTYSTKCKIDQQ